MKLPSFAQVGLFALVLSILGVNYTLEQYNPKSPQVLTLVEEITTKGSDNESTVVPNDILNGPESITITEVAPEEEIKTEEVDEGSTFVDRALNKFNLKKPAIFNKIFPKKQKTTVVNKTVNKPTTVKKSVSVKKTPVYSGFNPHKSKQQDMDYNLIIPEGYNAEFKRYKN